MKGVVKNTNQIFIIQSGKVNTWKDFSVNESKKLLN